MGAPPRGLSALRLLGTCLFSPACHTPDCHTPACHTPDGLPTDEAGVVALFEALHRPIHDVYGLDADRDGLHDHLAASFAGEALTEQYVEQWATRTGMARDGVGIEVLRVDYEAVAVIDRGPGFVAVDADWAVGGVVRHQAHRHPRVNRYRAVYTIGPTAQGPRLISVRLRDLRRLGRPNPGWPLDGLPSSESGYLDPLEYLDAGLGSAGSAP